MFNPKKIIWKEGLFLQPQHFQLAERFLLYTTQTRFSSYFSHYYGFTNYTVNYDALANGTFSITRAQGVMPDGTTFNIPKQDTAPSARTFEDHFTHDQQQLEVYFCLPMAGENKVNVRDNNNSMQPTPTRYINQNLAVYDEVYGAQKKEIEIGNFNFEILFGDESRDDYSSIQVARLQRNTSGNIEIDETFIPPLLYIGASHFLLTIIRSLLELLMAKNASLSQGRKQLKGGFAQFSSTEHTAFNLLHTINTYTPLLNYYHHVLNVHPMELFTLLMQLTGSLCTFSAEVTINSLPNYEHNNLSHVFSSYANIIRKILGADISAGCVSIPIEEIGPANYLCKISDESLFTVGTFYFGVAADASIKELIVGTLSRIKMCSRDKLELLIPSAMPGLPLIHAAHPPKGLSTKPGYIYFKLEQQGTLWEGIKTSSTIAFYFPHHYRDLRMEMLVLKT